MAGTLRGRETARSPQRWPRRGRVQAGGGAHRWSVPLPRSTDGRGPQARLAQAQGRALGARPAPASPRQPACQPGKAICREVARRLEARAARKGSAPGGWSPRGHGRAANRAEARGARGSRLLLPEARPRRRPSAHPLPPVARLASNRLKVKERPGRCRRPRPCPRPIPPTGPAPIPPRGS